MKIDLAKTAGSIAIFYVLFFFGGIFVHFFLSGEVYTLKYSLSLPSVWASLVLGLAIGWGLWNHFQWAWWLGLAGASFTLLSSIGQIFRLIAQGASIQFGVITVFLLLVCFLTLIIMPATKKQCSR